MRGGSGRCGVKREIAGRDGHLEARWGLPKKLRVANYELRIGKQVYGYRRERKFHHEGHEDREGRHGLRRIRREAGK